MEQLILITINKLIVSKRGDVAHIDKYIVSVKYLKRSFSKASARGNEDNFFDCLFLSRANLNQIDV